MGYNDATLVEIPAELRLLLLEEGMCFPDHLLSSGYVYPPFYALNGSTRSENDDTLIDDCPLITSAEPVMKPSLNFVHPTGTDNDSQYTSRYARETTRSIKDSTQNECTCYPNHVRAGTTTTVLQSVKTLNPVHNAYPTSTHPKTVFLADSNSSLTPFISDLPDQISSSVTIDTILYPIHVSF